MRYNVELMILSPHSSHYTQPLDLALFSPLKAAMAVEVDKIIRTGIVKLIKAEWLTAYIVARRKAFSMNNILSGWRAAGLLPFNPTKVIDCCPVNMVNMKQIQPQSPIITSALKQCILNSSPSDAIALHEGNTALLDMLDANQALNSSAKI